MINARVQRCQSQFAPVDKRATAAVSEAPRRLSMSRFRADVTRILTVRCGENGKTKKSFGVAELCIDETFLTFSLPVDVRMAAATVGLA